MLSRSLVAGATWLVLLMDGMFVNIKVSSQLRRRRFTVERAEYVYGKHFILSSTFLWIRLKILGCLFTCFVVGGAGGNSEDGKGVVWLGQEFQKMLVMMRRASSKLRWPLVALKPSVSS